MAVFLTAKLKVHNPSRRKRAILDAALEEYTRAYAYLLGWARQNLALLEERGRYKGRFTEKAIRAALPPSSDMKHVRLHSSARDSLLIDVAGALCSYFQLREKDPTTAFPTCRDPRPETYPDALKAFAAVTDDEREYNERRDRLLKVARGSVMPMFFCRPDAVPRHRNFSLLRDPARGTYYALLYLLPGDGADGRLTGAGNLVRMGWPQGTDPARETHRFRSRAGGALLLPLAFGKWHEREFLDRCIAGEANVRSAFLSRRDREGDDADYFIHVSFELHPDPVEPKTVLGVDRGLANLIALTVIDFEGRVIHQELHPGDDLFDFQKYVFTLYRDRQRRGKAIAGQRMVAKRNEEVCHRLANVIVSVAERYRSQVVLEWLSGFKERKKDFGRLKRAPLQRIQQILEYKLPLRGLPRPQYVGAAFTSKECPKCGYGRDVRGREVNRPSQDRFLCGQCGYETHADLNGSHNIARRFLARRLQGPRATLPTA